MKKTLYICLTMLILACCSPVDPSIQKTPPAQPSNEQIFRGSLKMSPTGNVLSDCNSGKQYAIVSKPQLDSLYQVATGAVNYSEKTVYAVLRGRLDSTTLAVTDIDALEAKNPWNTCLPFEFWCSGTEPFWDLEISQAENGMFYQDVGRQQGAKYAWTAAKVNGDIWIYEAPAISENQPALRVVIKKEPARNGMSDIVYNYSAELSIGNEKHKGVAVRWGEAKMVPKRGQ